jgi:hypothetical protein
MNARLSRDCLIEIQSQQNQDREDWTRFNYNTKKRREPIIPPSLKRWGASFRSIESEDISTMNRRMSTIESDRYILEDFIREGASSVFMAQHCIHETFCGTTSIQQKNPIWSSKVADDSRNPFTTSTRDLCKEDNIFASHELIDGFCGRAIDPRVAAFALSKLGIQTYTS